MYFTYASQRGAVQPTVVLAINGYQFILGCVDAALDMTYLAEAGARHCEHLPLWSCVVNLVWVALRFDLAMCVRVVIPLRVMGAPLPQIAAGHDRRIQHTEWHDSGGPSASAL